MKKFVKSSDMLSFDFLISFAGYIGSEESYVGYGSTKDEAEQDAMQQAIDNLSVSEVEYVDEGEWEVTVNYAGYFGVDETYTVYADSADEASFAGLDEAENDLCIED